MQLISKINEKMRLRFIKVQIGLENRFDMVHKNCLFQKIRLPLSKKIKIRKQDQ